jgi:AbrB family looped-hinge helix DNA binding protein
MKYHTYTKFMKTASLHSKIHKRFQSQDKFYGTTTMGARGQVVIPAAARKDLKLEAGDQLAVMGKFGKVLGVMKTDQMLEFVETIMSAIGGSASGGKNLAGMEKEFKKHFEKMTGKSLSK